CGIIAAVATALPMPSTIAFVLLLRFDAAGLLYDLAPANDVALDDLQHAVATAIFLARDGATDLGEPLCHQGMLERHCHSLAQLGQDLRRKTLRGIETEPALRYVFGHAALLGRRHVGKQRRPFGSRNPEPRDRPADHVLARRGNEIAGAIDGTREDVVDGLAEAAVGDIGGLDAG